MDIFIILFIFALPYTLINEGMAAPIIGLVGVVYLLFNRKRVKVDKKYFYLILSLIIAGLFSCIFTNNLTKSFNGLAMYIDVLIYYFVFMKYGENGNKIWKVLVYTVTAVAVFSIVYQGIIMNTRIYGNIGYANTYALLLLVALYFNEIIINNDFYSVIQIVLSLGILFTGSRNTLFYFVLFIAIKLIDEIKNNKGKKIYVPLINLVLTFLLYISLEKKLIALLIIAPIILYLIYSFTKKLNYKKKNIFSTMLIIAAVLSIFSFKTNTFERIMNTSINSAVLQERFVYFEDSLNHILNHKLGTGINSFEYRQYYEQSAFYDVRYIHNSILQITYDMGLIGGGIFILIFIYGLSSLFKYKGNNKIWLITLYLTLFFHSMLDFDFSFPSILIILSLIAALSSFQGQVEEKEVITKYSIKTNLVIIKIIALIFFIYLASINLIYVIGDEATIHNNFKLGRSMYEINKFITFKDPEVYSRMAESYKRESDINKDNGMLNSSITYLKNAEEINPYDPRIIGNIAFTYETLNDNSKVMEYYDKLLSKQKYNDELYKYYFAYLNDVYEKTKEKVYMDKANKLKEIYARNKENLNKKSIFMKDQMKTLDKDNK